MKVVAKSRFLAALLAMSCAATVFWPASLFAQQLKPSGNKAVRKTLAPTKNLLPAAGQPLATANIQVPTGSPENMAVGAEQHAAELMPIIKVAPQLPPILKPGQVDSPSPWKRSSWKPEQSNVSGGTSETKFAADRSNKLPVVRNALQPGPANEQPETGNFKSESLPPIVSVKEPVQPMLPVIRATAPSQQITEEVAIPTTVVLPSDPAAQQAALPTEQVAQDVAIPTTVAEPSVSTAPLSPRISTQTTDIRRAASQPGRPGKLGTNFPADGQRQIAEFIETHKSAASQVVESGNFQTSRDKFTTPGDPAALSNVIADPGDVPVISAESFAGLAPLKPVGVPTTFEPRANTQPPRMARVPRQDIIQPRDIIQPIPDRNIQAYGPANMQPARGSTRPPVRSTAVTQSIGDPGNYFQGSGGQPGPVQVSVDYNGGFNDFGFVAGATGYFTFDYLYFARIDGDFRAGNQSTLDTFDWVHGGRFTLGRRLDTIEGWEATYMGFDPWLAVSSQTSASGQLIGAVFGAGGIPNSALSAFRNGTFLEQFQKTDLHSLEVNRTWWGADVAKTYLGIRFMVFDDEFRLASANTAGDQGHYIIDLDNRLLGIQSGGEIVYDYGRRTSLALSGSFGGYANFNRGRTGVFNNASQIVNFAVENTDLAAHIQIGAAAHIKIGPRARLMVGYELLTLFNVMATEDNFTTNIFPNTGSVYFRDSAGFHGASVGLEFYR